MVHAFRAHDEKAETPYADFRNEVLVTSAQIALAVPFSWRMISTVSFAAFWLTSAQSTFAPSRANRTAAAFPFPQPGPTDQWGLIPPGRGTQKSAPLLN